MFDAIFREKTEEIARIRSELSEKGLLLFCVRKLEQILILSVTRYRFHAFFRDI